MPFVKKVQLPCWGEHEEWKGPGTAWSGEGALLESSPICLLTLTALQTPERPEAELSS